MATVACIALCGIACAKPGPGNDRRGDNDRRRGGDTHQQRREPTGGYRTERHQQRGGYDRGNEHRQHDGDFSRGNEHRHHNGGFGRNNDHRRNDNGFHIASSWRDGWYVKPAPPSPPPPPPPPQPPRRF